MNHLIIENPPPITDEYNFRSYNPYSYSGVLDTGGSGASGTSSGSGSGEAPSNLGKVIEAGGKIIHQGLDLFKNKQPSDTLPETPKPSEPITPQTTTPAAQPFEQVDTTLPGNPLEPGNNGLLTDPNAGNLPLGTPDPSSMGGVADETVNQPSPGGVLPNVETPPPDNLLNGDGGVLDSGATADPFANVDTEGALGPTDPSSIPNVTSPLHLFDTGTNLSDAAGAVTLPEGATQMADGSMTLADGTKIAADGTISGEGFGSVVQGYGAKTLQGFQKIAPWASAAMGIYDMVKNKPTGSGAMADFGAVLALSNPVMGFMFAVPAILGAIFGKKNKPKFYSGSDLDKLTFRDYSEGDQYLYNDLSSHGFQNDNSNFRYNLKNNRWEKAVFETRDEPSNNESGSDEISYIAGWEDVPLVQNPDDGKLYLQINKYKYMELEGTYNRLPEDIQDQVMESLKTNPPDYSQRYWNEPGQTRVIESPDYNEGGA